MSLLNPNPKVKNVKFTRGLVASRKLHAPWARYATKIRQAIRWKKKSDKKLAAEMAHERYLQEAMTNKIIQQAEAKQSFLGRIRTAVKRLVGK